MNPFNLMGRLLGRTANQQSIPVLEAKVGRMCTVGPNALDDVAPANFEAERIAESIRDYPEDWAWTMKGYKLIRTPSGFVLWVANQDYGLAEVYSNGGKGDFSKPEQAIIWPAVEGWLARHKVGFTGRPVKPRIRYFRARYFCESPEHPWRGFGHTADEAYQSWLAAVSVQYREKIPKSVVLTVWSAANE